MDLLDIAAELGQRISTAQPLPSTTEIMITGVIALAVVILAWPIVRILTTVVHEAGHAVIATLAGRSLQGIRLHTDTSGLTVTRGRPDGPGMICTLLAGYPAPALFGLLAAVVLSRGYAVALLWVCVALLALMLLKIRNFYGLLVLLAVGLSIAGASWYLRPQLLSLIAFTATWLLLWSAPRAALEQFRRRGPSSDAGQLARLTRAPAGMWAGGFVIFAVLCLVGAVAIMVPALPSLPALPSGVFG